jgi:hypothetical protein
MLNRLLVNYVRTACSVVDHQNSLSPAVIVSVQQPIIGTLRFTPGFGITEDNRQAQFADLTAIHIGTFPSSVIAEVAALLPFHLYGRKSAWESIMRIHFF